jgi:hypothetical protein
MPAVFFFGEDNGASTGAPLRGTTRTTGVTQVNWKNTDDVATVYSTSPIAAGNNSYEKFQFGVFTGTFNQISNGKWQHVSGVLGAGLTLKTLPTGGYTTPATTSNATLIHNVTLTGDIATGLPVLFGTSGPNVTGASATATLAAVGYTQYFPTQLQTTNVASAGDTAVVTFMFRYDET